MALPAVDMLGRTIAGCTVTRSVPSIGTGARWELTMPCGHKQIFDRKALRQAERRERATLHCDTCRPRRSLW